MKVLAAGSIAALIYRYARPLVRARRARGAGARWDDFAPDPRDPVQGFDEVIELKVEPLAVDALSTEDYEAAQDLAGLESDVDASAFDDIGVDFVDALGISRRELSPIIVEDISAARPRPDDGDLYGAHTPLAVDTDHPDNDEAFNEGQNWIEALETSAIENGAEPERSLDDIIDDEDILRAPHKSDLRDRPIADFGSGGRRGL